jgi:uncharacterized membrane protein (DUF441 family)
MVWLTFETVAKAFFLGVFVGALLTIGALYLIIKTSKPKA